MDQEWPEQEIPTEGTSLSELMETIAILSDEVQSLRGWLDGLLAWATSCPICAGEKVPTEWGVLPACHCNWSWEGPCTK